MLLGTPEMIADDVEKWVFGECRRWVQADYTGQTI